MELTDGQRLKLLATKCKTKFGISHEQFAEMIGITPPHLSDEAVNLHDVAARLQATSPIQF